ncbi:hypothetical protein SCHIN_v1c01430 [Spiroplasma chinense]|uniref:Uncharacterized protein n=1 Tax=Spiroplasma chinense TaxID=216932 RepID=A0A5B9Y306_9MOLU|nr:hypothetical protein [Spiroplasma chinense]QEH61341.1 hypothetical protein SCHIN_v1c01430 [Spiroplasma chinense]
MKKLLTVFSSISVLSLTSYSVSCFGDINTGKAPNIELSEKIKISELGEFQGKDDLPSLEELIHQINIVNKETEYFEELPNFGFSNEYTYEVRANEYIKFSETPSETKASLEILEKPKSVLLKGKLEVTYKYSKKTVD